MSSLHDSDFAIKDAGACADRMQAERAACDGLSTAALRAGVVAETREVIEALTSPLDDAGVERLTRRALAVRAKLGGSM